MVILTLRTTVRPLRWWDEECQAALPPIWIRQPQFISRFHAGPAVYILAAPSLSCAITKPSASTGKSYSQHPEARNRQFSSKFGCYLQFSPRLGCYLQFSPKLGCYLQYLSASQQSRKRWSTAAAEHCEFAVSPHIGQRSKAEPSDRDQSFATPAWFDYLQQHISSHQYEQTIRRAATAPLPYTCGYFTAYGSRAAVAKPSTGQQGYHQGYRRPSTAYSQRKDFSPRSRRHVPISKEKKEEVKRMLSTTSFEGSLKRLSTLSTNSVVTAIFNPISADQRRPDSASSNATAVYSSWMHRGDPRDDRSRAIGAHLAKAKDDFVNALELLIADESFPHAEREAIVQSEEYAALREFAPKLEDPNGVKAKVEEEFTPRRGLWIDPYMLTSPAMKHPILSPKEAAEWEATLRQSELAIDHLKTTGGVCYRQYHYLRQEQRLWNVVAERVEKLRKSCVRTKAKFGLGERRHDHRTSTSSTLNESGSTKSQQTALSDEEIETLARLRGQCERLRDGTYSPTSTTPNEADKDMTAPAPATPDSKALRDFWQSKEEQESRLVASNPPKQRHARTSWGQLFPVKTAWRINSLPDMSKGPK
ncbi:hypothetical protein BZA05DRAFT_451457 [Tricharina praecox]|uniref:uncharacterized protein n=1 Tax=Tricharina praecox TaxID=43433 RepID=UPI0022211E5E|nr:uncharacterized protein BZA05DRAFT_451457 [Tricharina praecox]KAI5853312.1 hypothetical protein BZA05DRAFT_451457 [Tricharina praecox]